MGKEKRGRRKLHAPSANEKAKADGRRNQASNGPNKINPKVAETVDISMDVADKVSVKKSMAGSKATTNPFQGMKITKELLKQQLPDFDAQSAITSKTFRGLNIKKKEKLRLRHELWMEKIDGVQAARQAQKAKKKREKTAVVGDLQGLSDALPTLELLMKESSKEALAREEKARPRKGILMEKQRRKEMLEDMAIFGKVQTVPEFQADPINAILQHLQNKMKQEEMDT